MITPTSSNEDFLNSIDTNVFTNLINNNKDIYKNFLENINMNFDKMFKNIRNKEDIINIFGRENLIKNFGSNAVENTSENFAEHFIKVYESQSEYHDFIFNRNMDIKIKNYGFYNENISKIKSVNLKNENIIDFLESSTESYDFIQTSNIMGHFMDHNGDLYFDVFSCKELLTTDFTLILNFFTQLRQCLS